MGDDYALAVARRFREELAAHGYRSEKQAADKIGKPQQWLNARQHAQTQWGAVDLHQACEVLGLDHMYVVTGRREADIVAEFLSGNSGTAELVAGVRAQFNELRRRFPEIGDIVDEPENWPQGFSDGVSEKAPTVSRRKDCE
jgi:hypothetical protein